MRYRTRLFYKGICEVVDGRGMAVITLTDQEEKKALTVVCDEMMKSQLQLRTCGGRTCDKLLPEVMTAMLKDLGGTERYEIEVYDIIDGEYKTVLTDVTDQTQFPVRLSDAVLLSEVSGIPVYIDNRLLMRQGMDYASRQQGKMAIPINVLSGERLEEEMQKAIDCENYRLASQIKEELQRRQKRTERQEE